MKLLYISEHRFVKETTGEVYTTGQMGEKYFDRFRDSFENVTVIGLCEDESRDNVGKIIEKVDLNSDFVKYVFVQTSGTIAGRLNADSDIKKKYIQLFSLYDRVAIKVPSLMAEFVVRLAKKNKKLILVEMVGCPWDSLWNHGWKGKVIAPIIWSVTRRAVKNAPYTMYVTNEFLQRRYPCKGKTIGCSDVALPSLDESLLERRLDKIKHMTSNKPIVLGTTAAVNVRYKGQKYVIDAVSKLNKQGYNFEYHLVGGGDNTYLKLVAEQCGVADKVKFFGSLTHEKVFKYLDNIDVYVQSSLTEGLPRALVEAMSRGCPALGSRTGGIPELLNEEFIFRKGSVDAICTLLKKMDKKIMSEEAKRSFKKAKEYDKNLLDKKRAVFYKAFIEAGTVNSGNSINENY